MVPKIWHSDETSPDSLYLLITYGVCKEYYSSTFIICTIEYQTQTNTEKIVAERTSTFCVLSYRHDNFYCASMVIFTVRIIFFSVLRKCYKITVSHSNFYLEFLYSFRRTFFSVYLHRPFRLTVNIFFLILKYLRNLYKFFPIISAFPFTGAVSHSKKNCMKAHTLGEQKNSISPSWLSNIHVFDIGLFS